MGGGIWGGGHLGGGGERVSNWCYIRYKHICMLAYTQASKNTRKQVHTCTHICMHAHIHLHAHMHIHTHVILITGLITEFFYFFIIILYCQLHGGKSIYITESDKLLVKTTAWSDLSNTQFNEGGKMK